jgi:hypothetical protein
MIARRLGRCSGIGGNDENTLLLLHGDSFADASPYGRTIINNGATISDNGRFDKCIYVNGAGALPNTYLYTNNMGNLGTGDFTVDFWLKFATTGSQYALFSTLLLKANWNESGATGDFFADYEFETLEFRIYNGTQNVSPKGTVVNKPTDGLFHHYAFVKSNGVVTIYIDGNSVFSFSSSIPLLGNTVGFGRGDKRGWGVTGYYSEFRISNIARWTGNFTPPTEPYTK